MGAERKTPSLLALLSEHFDKGKEFDYRLFTSNKLKVFATGNSRYIHNKPTIIQAMKRIVLSRPLQNKEVEGRGVLGIKGASERGGSKE
ncbi:hypothetical protein HMPREF1553_00848 [Porphyromonas gingivalis F0568]|nr:hypothetical protein HMPREF1553_00848 [Porphyromonas gingivalis F0568]